MRKLGLAAIAAIATFSLVGCGSSDDSADSTGDTGATSSAPASSTADDTTSTPTTTASAPSVTAWCTAYTSEPEMSNDMTATEVADELDKTLQDLRSLGYPDGMPTNVQSAIEDQYPGMESFIKALRAFGDETISDLRTDDAKKTRWEALEKQSSDALDTPAVVSTYLDKNC
ncbi:MAG: hypothetical protein QM638_00585 [Nocardioides sp.]|uniref:hypothetical protein n=1 Tax=Nocardioides sp. TaxID=35761 RepID=UPI0039E25FBC